MSTTRTRDWLAEMVINSASGDGSCLVLGRLLACALFSTIRTLGHFSEKFLFGLVSITTLYLIDRAFR